MERQCDRYALESYVRLLSKNPEYRTFSNDKKHIVFENFIRQETITVRKDLNQPKQNSLKIAANSIISKLKVSILHRVMICDERIVFSVNGFACVKKRKVRW